MHICQDEIIAIGGVLGFIPYCCKWCWAKARALLTRRAS